MSANLGTYHTRSPSGERPTPNISTRYNKQTVHLHNKSTVSRIQSRGFDRRYVICCSHTETLKRFVRKLVYDVYVFTTPGVISKTVPSDIILSYIVS